jgi:hypothetical protein
MNTCEIKLKCLELAHRSDLPPVEVVARAEIYRRYIEDVAEPKGSKSGQVKPKPQ